MRLSELDTDGDNNGDSNYNGTSNGDNGSSGQSYCKRKSVVRTKIHRLSVLGIDVWKQFKYDRCRRIATFVA